MSPQTPTVLDTLPTLTGSFKFRVPDGHPDKGKEIGKEFPYRAIPTPGEDEEGNAIAWEPEARAEAVETANAVIVAKKWDIVDMVNELLRNQARSNAYQIAMAPYKVNPNVTEEDIRERMVRDYIRLGKSEEQARKLVAKALDETEEVTE